MGRFVFQFEFSWQSLLAPHNLKNVVWGTRRIGRPMKFGLP